MHLPLLIGQIPEYLEPGDCQDVLIRV
jgi:hypothetical protein